jgi:hypothetical protein
MQLSQLRDIVRLRLRDTETPYFWTDAWIDECLNEALEEAIIRAMFLRSTETLPVVVGENILPVNRTILMVDNSVVAKFVSATNAVSELPYLTPKDFAVHVGNDINGVGSPLFFCSGEEDNTIQVYPIPDVTGVILLPIRRGFEEADRMVNDSDIPNIPERYHRPLIEWAVYRSFSVPDSEFGDPKAAETAEAKFDRTFGRRPSARFAEAIAKGLGNRRAYHANYLGFTP